MPERISRRAPGHYVMIAKTLGNVESNILAPMRELYGDAYVSQPYLRHGLTKARVFDKEFILLGADNIRSVAKLQGKAVGYAAGDEGPTWEQSLLQMLKTRMTHALACSDITGNPEGPRHPFKTDLIDRAGELGVYHLAFGLDDNPTLTEDAKAQLRRELVGVWYKRLILGLWVAAEGAIYDMIDEARHVVDVLPAISHYWLGIDYGTASVTTYWLLGLGADQRLYFVDRWRWDAAKSRQQLTDVQFAERMESWLAQLNVTVATAMVPADAASFVATLQQFKQAGKLPHVDALAVADRSPGSVLRRIRSTSSLLALDRLKFSRTIERQGGLDEWMGRAWDPKAQERGEDIPLKVGDHDTDAGEYALSGARHIWRNWIQEAA